MLTRAGVVGHPIGHSLSPTLHRAAYAALGLREHRYDAYDVGQGELAGFVAGLDDTWLGLSVTMPGKEEALAIADSAGEDATITGSANTLVRRDGGWYADNTDVYGISEAIRTVCPADGVTYLIGSGATARSALLSLSRLGVRRVSVVVRAEVRVETLQVASQLGISLQPQSLQSWASDTNGAATGGEPVLVVNTVPTSAAPVELPVAIGAGSVVFDVNYAPWPTPLAAAARRRGARIIGGGEMLVHQAMAQVELMTGHRAPGEAMRAALEARLAQRGSTEA